MVNIDKDKGYFTWRPIYFYDGNKAEFFLQWEMFNTSL